MAVTEFDFRMPLSAQDSLFEQADVSTFGAQMTAIGDGTFLASWLDRVSFTLNMQVFSASGEALGQPVAVLPVAGLGITDWYDLAVSDASQIWIVASQGDGTGPYRTSVTSFSVEDLTTASGGEITETWYSVDATTTLNSQVAPSIALLDNGNAAITWIDTTLVDPTDPNQILSGVAGIVGLNVMSAPSTTLTGALTVNNLSFQTGQFTTSVATLDGGGFVVVWDGRDIFGDATIEFQLFRANGSKLGTPFSVPPDSHLEPFGGQVAALAGGGFVVAFQTAFRADFQSDIVFRIYDEAGTLYENSAGATWFVTSGNLPGIQSDCTVVAKEDGGFIIAWSDASGLGEDPSTGSYAQEFDANGKSESGVFLINAGTIGEQTAPVLAYSDKVLAATWQSFSDSTAVLEDNAKYRFFNLDVPLLIGDAEADTIDGSAERDVINGEGNDDFLNGQGGDDFLNGGDGDDVLDGGDGDDVVDGGDGDDTLVGGAGENTLIGGDGFDTVSYLQADSSVDVYLQFDFALTAHGRDYFNFVESLIGSNFDDRLIGDAGYNEFFGAGGDDIIKTKGGDDFARGREGNDRLIGDDNGNERLIGGFGDDVILGYAGDDYLSGNQDNDFVYGGRGNDTLLGGFNDDLLRGNRNDDVLYGGDGSDRLFGGGNNDTLFGDAEQDFLLGENGNDILDGGAGNDNLTGGAGSDTFVFTSAASGGGGFDRIKDFEQGVDLIDLSGFEFANFANDVSDLISQSGQNVRIDFGGGDVLLIEGALVTDFGAPDFIL